MFLDMNSYGNTSVCVLGLVTVVSGVGVGDYVRRGDKGGRVTHMSKLGFICPFEIITITGGGMYFLW